jgi:hypothetical protein
MCAAAKNQSSSSRFDRMRTSAYWTATILVAFENSAGAMWVLLPLIPRFSHTNTALVFAEYLRTMLAHLGYPPYFKYLLGPWQLACAAALVAPRLARVKEWAYFGAFLNYSSAFMSHQFAGDRPDITSGALAVLTIMVGPCGHRIDDLRNRRLNQCIVMGHFCRHLSPVADSVAFLAATGL